MKRQWTSTILVLIVVALNSWLGACTDPTKEG